MQLTVANHQSGFILRQPALDHGKANQLLLQLLKARQEIKDFAVSGLIGHRKRQQADERNGVRMRQRGQVFLLAGRKRSRQRENRRSHKTPGGLERHVAAFT